MSLSNAFAADRLRCTAPGEGGNVYGVRYAYFGERGGDAERARYAVSAIEAGTTEGAGV